jgi:polyhydroxyalkanoate synthesis regulator phasin
MDFDNSQRDDSIKLTTRDNIVPELKKKIDKLERQILKIEKCLKHASGRKSLLV